MKLYYIVQNVHWYEGSLDVHVHAHLQDGTGEEESFDFIYPNGATAAANLRTDLAAAATIRFGTPILAAETSNVLDW